MTAKEKKQKLFEMIMESQVNCRPVQFSISDRHCESVVATIHDAPSNAMMKLFAYAEMHPEFARIEVNNSELNIVCW